MPTEYEQNPHLRRALQDILKKLPWDEAARVLDVASKSFVWMFCAGQRGMQGRALGDAVLRVGPDNVDVLATLLRMPARKRAGRRDPKTEW